jgi:tetratricopeptide (TPR) repeat protein
MASSTRSRSSEARALAAALALLALLAAGTAQAAAKAKDGAEAQAKAEFKKGQTAYNLGRFSEALASFSKAYEIKALPPILFNIAQCHRQLGNFERAVFFYRRFLELTPAGSGNAETVSRLLQESETRLAEQQRTAAQTAEEQRQKDLQKAREAAARAEADAAQKRHDVIDAQAAANAAARPAVGGLTSPSSQIPPTAVEKTPLHQQWWLWTIVAVVVVGATATGVGYAVTEPKPSPTSLGSLNAR